jgi:hypothetical protein
MTIHAAMMDKIPNTETANEFFDAFIKLYNSVLYIR